MRVFVIRCLVAVLLLPALAAAQTPPDPQAQQAAPETVAGQRFRVYLDCRGGGPGGSCFPEYLREQIRFVDFVQRPQDADVHVFGTSQTTGGNGREVVLRFVGVGRYEGIDRELKAITMAGDSENTRRDAVLRTALVGLLSYLAREGLPTEVDLSVNTVLSVETTASRSLQVDPWNAWVFSIRGSGTYSAEESRSTKTWNVSLSADRVTEDWAISFGSRWEERVQSFDVDDNETLDVTRVTKNANFFIAKSGGSHWSYGVKGRVSASTFGNEELAVEFFPVVEFNIFPYEEYSERQLRFQYGVGVVSATYNEVTLFGVTEETHPKHEASVDFDLRQPFGTLRAGFEYSQYLHDTSFYRMQVDGSLTFRVARGLSLSVNGSASRVRDQLSLPLDDATPEEVLLNIRELFSGFNVRITTSITYTFGSLFNNVVNPRFGGDRGRSGGGGDGGGGPGGFGGGR